MQNYQRIYELITKVFWTCVIIDLFYGVFFVVSKIDIKSSDFVSFITGARMIKEGMGSNLYDSVAQFSVQQQIIDPKINPGLLPFRNLPLFAAFFVAFTYLPLVSSYKLWASTLVGLLVLTEFLFAKIFKDINQYTLVVFLLPVLYYPSLVSIFQAQLTPLLLLIFLLIYEFAKSGKSLWAGILSGLLLLKLQYVLAIPFLFFLIGDRKKFLEGCLISALIILCLSLLIVGPGFLIRYPQFLIRTENPFFGSVPQNMFTLFPILIDIASTLKLPNFLPFVLNVTAYAFILGFFAVQARKVSFDKAFVALTFFSIIFSIHALVHDLIVLLVPILILINLLNKKKREKEGFLILFIALFLILFPALPDLFFSVKAFWASLVLLASGLYLIKPNVSVSRLSD